MFGALKPENEFKDEMIEEKQDYNVTFFIFVSYRLLRFPWERKNWLFVTPRFSKPTNINLPAYLSQ